MSDQTAALGTSGLTKRFRGGQLAVADLDLTVPSGTVFGFLGPNGSGKTTTIRMLLGLVVPTRGSWELLGAPMPAGASRVLRRVGSLIEGPAFHPYLSGWQNLQRLDAADSLANPRSTDRRIIAALERVGLAAAARKRYRAYSLGMRQRLGLAAALLQPRELLVLDEPTNGLDPQGIREMRELLLELNAAGTTIFLSSHLLAEIEQMCTRVGVLDRGRLVLQEQLDTLTAPTGRIRVRTPDVPQAIALLDGRVETRGVGEVVVLGTDTAELNAALVSAGIRVEEIGPVRRLLEDVVLEASEGTG